MARYLDRSTSMWIVTRARIIGSGSRHQVAGCKIATHGTSASLGMVAWCARLPRPQVGSATGPLSSPGLPSPVVTLGTLSTTAFAGPVVLDANHPGQGLTPAYRATSIHAHGDGFRSGTVSQANDDDCPNKARNDHCDHSDVSLCPGPGEASALLVVYRLPRLKKQPSCAPQLDSHASHRRHDRRPKSAYNSSRAPCAKVSMPLGQKPSNTVPPIERTSTPVMPNGMDGLGKSSAGVVKYMTYTTRR
jgi:hypothetical protein